MIIMGRRNGKNEMLKAFEKAVIENNVRTLRDNLNGRLTMGNRSFFYLIADPRHFVVGCRELEDGEYQYFIRYYGFQFDERFEELGLDFGDKYYIEATLTAFDIMQLMGEEPSFDYTSPDVYIWNLEGEMDDLIHEALKRKRA